METRLWIPNLNRASRLPASGSVRQVKRVCVTYVRIHAAHECLALISTWIMSQITLCSASSSSTPTTFLRAGWKQMVKSVKRIFYPHKHTARH